VPCASSEYGLEKKQADLKPGHWLQGNQTQHILLTEGQQVDSHQLQVPRDYNSEKLKAAEAELQRVKQNSKTIKQQQRQLLQLLQDKDQQLEELGSSNYSKNSKIQQAQMLVLKKVFKHQKQKHFWRWVRNCRPRNDLKKLHRVFGGHGTLERVALRQKKETLD